MRRLLKSRKFWLALAAIGVIAAIRFTGVAQYLSIETLRQHRQELTAFVAQNWVYAALTYIAVYTAAVAFSVPGALILTLTGGFLFGAYSGTALSVTSATLGATLVFLFAKTVFGDRALHGLGPQAESLARNIQRNAWSYLLALRLVPLFPFFLVNLIPALAGVRLSTYVLTTFFGIIPGTAIFSLSGAGLGRVLEEGGDVSFQSILTPEIIAALVALALLALASIPLRRRFQA
jgi:uncharacterized membrane protein YdjX (TVP38/TMEM64 family)